MSIIKKFEEYAYNNGKTAGKEEMRLGIAKSLLAMNMNIQDIVKATGLTEEEI